MASETSGAAAMIRPATPDDAPAIRAVHRAAFASDTEADLVEALERDGASVVSLVAEDQRDIIGHVLLSRMAVSGDGRGYRAVGLGPLGVLPAFRGAGIGSRLVEGTVAIAQATGEELVFVLGEPDYYARFGFAAGHAAPFASPYAGPYFMALPLKPDFVPPTSGTATYARAFADLESDG